MSTLISTPPRLSETHLSKLVTEHQLSPAVIAGRGYGSLTTSFPAVSLTAGSLIMGSVTERIALNDAWKRQNGFTGAQALLQDGIVAPTYSVDGTHRGARVIPDYPRLDALGRVVRFEEGGQGLPTLDLHPGARGLLHQNGPWFYTTSVLFADALLSLGYVAFALSEGTAKGASGQALEMHRLAVEFQEHMDGREMGRVHVLLFDSRFDEHPGCFNALGAFSQVLRASESDVVAIHPRHDALTPNESLQSVLQPLSAAGIVTLAPSP